MLREREGVSAPKPGREGEREGGREGGGREGGGRGREGWRVEGWREGDFIESQIWNNPNTTESLGKVNR